MNNKLTMLLAAGALVVGAQTSKALTASDADPLGVAIAAGTTYPNSFKINGTDGDAGTFTVDAGYGFPTGGATFNSNPAFNTATDTIVTGTGSMGFWFQVGPEATYHVDIKDITLSGNGNGTSITRNVLLQTGLSVQIEAALQTTGQVNYLVTVNPGSVLGSGVILDYAYLQIDYTTPPPTGTPDGGATAMLLGLGSLGVAALRRKLS